MRAGYGAAVCAIIVAACGSSSPSKRATASGSVRAIPAPGGCTNPKSRGVSPSQSPLGGGLSPKQLAAAYGIDGLWRSGFEGQGRRVALIEVGSSFPAAAAAPISQCYGPWGPTIQHVVVGSNPPPGGEGALDPIMVRDVAPGARIDEFESGPGLTSDAQLPSVLPRVLPSLIDAALNPSNTGGKLVDTISMSLGACERAWPAGGVPAVEAALKRAASLGVAVFVSGGDGGSAESFTTRSGATACIPFPVNVRLAPTLAGVRLGVIFPASSPYVTAVGGTELAINGAIPPAGAPNGGAITDEVVWNQQSPQALSTGPNRFFAGGGGQSALFSTTDAPWQQTIGLTGPEKKPDIAALAGSPNSWPGGIGTSVSSPMMAGAVAVLDGYLVAHGAKPTGPLNPVLYRIAANRAQYAKVFHDVIHGNNDLLHLGCCQARQGYDEASGLGSLDIQALADVLLQNR